MTPRAALDVRRSSCGATSVDWSSTIRLVAVVRLLVCPVVGLRRCVPRVGCKGVIKKSLVRAEISIESW